MTTEAIKATEPLPWERYEVETNGDPKVSMFLRPATTIEVFDRPQDDSPRRVVGVYVGSLTMHLSDFDGGDREIIAAIEPLMDALIVLRSNAQQRLDES